MHSWVRHLEVGLVDRKLVVEQQVEIERNALPSGSRRRARLASVASRKVEVSGGSRHVSDLHH